jgi:hypothetical protein
MENYVNKAFNELKDIKLRNDRDYIAGRIDEVLKEQENKSYELSLGYYDSDGFQSQYPINGDSDTALMHINGSTIIDEVIDMFETMDFTAVTAIKIYFDDYETEYNGWDYSLVEYNGYELFTDL